ncbi:MAG: preprotein translocase subunit YajC [Clostridia bacterium]|nr:preprotein translocase subunit YajC [Clostridia bacterium]
MNYVRVLAETVDPTGSYWISIVMILVLVVVFYFFAIRPQKKKDREDAAMRNNLMVGDEITTIGGIIGRVVSIKDETCVIETSKACTKIRILKTAIRSVDVPVSATKGYVAPATEKAEEETEEKTEKKSKKK